MRRQAVQRTKESGPGGPRGPVATRAQLLDAAAVVFASRGFHDATVREICRAAGANVAAVSYHFGDKGRLYSAVLRETGRRAALIAAPVRDAAPANPPAKRLGAFVRSMLSMILAEGPASLHGQILAREMIDPTAALDQVVAEFMRPQAEHLQGVVRELVGPKVPAADVRRLALSVVSQILFYKHCRPVLERLYPGECPGAAQLDELTRHITAFSLAALRGLARPGSKRRALEP